KSRRLLAGAGRRGARIEERHRRVTARSWHSWHSRDRRLPEVEARGAALSREERGDGTPFVPGRVEDPPAPEPQAERRAGFPKAFPREELDGGHGQKVFRVLAVLPTRASPLLLHHRFARLGAP